MKFLRTFLQFLDKFDWNLDTFKKTQKKLKYSDNLANSLFPNNIDDLLLFFNNFINIKMINIYKKKRFNKSSVRSKILNSLKIRFGILNQYRNSIKKSIKYLSRPSKQFLSTKLIYNIVDAIWTNIGDKSKDINFYSKRVILATIYGSAILFWLNDNSKNLDKTNNFLEKSIMNMNVISSLKENFRKKFSNFL